MRMSEEERLSHYTTHALFGSPADTSDIERQPYHRMLLKEPMFDAMCYAYGYTSHEAATEAFKEPASNFQEQVLNIKKNQTRTPHSVLDIGAGRGELTAAFLWDDVPCYAVEPAPMFGDIASKTFMNWLDGGYEEHCLNKSFLEAAKTTGVVDTVIMCESIEHIRENEFEEAMPLIEEKLRETHGLFIVTNWVNYHPIHVDPSGWDHITEINELTYSALAKRAEKTILSRGSHLVLRY